MNAVDTNVLIYVHDPRDPVKQAAADSLVQSLLNGILLWQVACEFISASTKLEPFGFDRAKACKRFVDYDSCGRQSCPSGPY